MFVGCRFVGVCYFVYLFRLKTVLVDVFGVYINEARFGADPLCLLRLFVKLVGGWLVHLGDYSSMVSVFIRSASLVSIHLFIQNPIHRPIILLP